MRVFVRPTGLQSMGKPTETRMYVLQYWASGKTINKLGGRSHTKPSSRDHESLDNLLLHISTIDIAARLIYGILWPPQTICIIILIINDLAGPGLVIRPPIAALWVFNSHSAERGEEAPALLGLVHSCSCG